MRLDELLAGWHQRYRSGMRCAQIFASVGMLLFCCEAAHALPAVIPFDGPLIGSYTYGFDINNPDLSDLAALPPNAMGQWLAAVPRSNPYGNTDAEILIFADVVTSLYSRCSDPALPCSNGYNVYDITWTLELNENHPLVLAAAPGDSFTTHLVLPGWERSGFGGNAVNIFTDSFEVDGVSTDVMVSTWMNNYYFLSLALENMTPGASGQRTVRLQYDMVGSEPVVQGVSQVPSLQLLGHLNVVPEPGTFVLLALGLVGLSGIRDRARH